jgi:serine/threonine protein kinase
LSKEGVGEEDVTKSFCGSPAYLSPEMLKRKGTGRAADIYGIGNLSKYQKIHFYRKFINYC